MRRPCKFGRVHQWRRFGNEWRCGTCELTLHSDLEVGETRRVVCPHPGHREKAYDVKTRPSIFLGRDFIRINGSPYSDFQVEFWRCAECGRSAPHPERGHFIVQPQLTLAS